MVFKQKIMIVDQVKEWELKEGVGKNGKPWKAKSISIKVGEEWFSGFIFENDWPKVKTGELDIKIVEKPYNGKVYKNWEFNYEPPSGSVPAEPKKQEHFTAPPTGADDDLPF